MRTRVRRAGESIGLMSITIIDNVDITADNDPMSGYTKLFQSMLASTVWREPNELRIVWVTMLLMAGKDGIVEASIPGLADFARVSVEACRAAVARLEGPDEDSRSKDYDGARIRPIDGGWILVNHAKYRAKMGPDERREYNRVKQAEHRQRATRATNITDVNDSQRQSTTSRKREHCQHNAEAEASTEEESDPIAVAKNHERVDELRRNADRSPSTGTDHGIKDSSAVEQSNPAPKTAPPSSVKTKEKLMAALHERAKSFPHTPANLPRRRSPPAPDLVPPPSQEEIQTRLAEFAYAVIYDLGVPVELRADALKGMCRQFGVPYDSLSIHQALDAHRITLTPKDLPTPQ